MTEPDTSTQACERCGLNPKQICLGCAMAAEDLQGSLTKAPHGRREDAGSTPAPAPDTSHEAVEAIAVQMTLHYSWYFVAPVLRALAAERDALKEDKRVLSIALMDAQRHGDDLSARVAELEAYADAKDAELRRAYALATEAESRCADLEAALREAYEQAAKVAEEHRCEVIADGTPDTIIDAHVNGVLSGYQDAVKQIAGAIRALAPPQAPKE